MDKVRELANILKKKFDEPLTVAAVWGTVKSIDWNEKTAVVEGIADSLDYFDVVLGIGDVFLKPKINSKVLIGLIGKVASYVILCEELDEVHITAKKIIIDSQDVVIDGGSEGGVPIAGKIAQRLNEIESALHQLKTNFNIHTHGFTAPATVLTPNLGSMTYQVPDSQPSDFENTEFKH